ncbi:MFS transporter [Tsukamurella sputi]|nr:MFS transporter [Tsukamurella sputi]
MNVSTAQQPSGSTPVRMPGATPPGRRVRAAQARAGARPTAVPQKSRWLVIIAFGLLVAATQVLVVNYAPVTNDAARHFGVSVASVGWLSQVFPLVFFLLAIPAGLALDRWFRRALVLGAMLTAAGAFVRLVADDYTWTMVGQVIAAVGQPFILNAIPRLAVAYLAAKDRTTGIALASAATFLGMVVGYLLGAFLPGVTHVHTITLVSALIAMDAAGALVLAVHFFKPLGGDEAVPSTGGLRAFRSALRNRYLRRLCAVVAIPMGTFLALATYVQPLLEPAGISESSAGLILSFTMIAGVVGSAIVPVWAERHRSEVKVMAVGIVITAGACLHLALVPSTAMAYVTLIGVGFVLLPALPIVLSLSERHAVDAESTAAGLIWMAGNLGGVIVATVISLLVGHPAIAFLALAGATALALPALRRFDALESRGAGTSGTDAGLNGDLAVTAG